jgi:hypothetical protein
VGKCVNVARVRRRRAHVHAYSEQEAGLDGHLTARDRYVDTETRRVSTELPASVRAAGRVAR